MQNELIIRNSVELFRYSASEIMAMIADGNYCDIILTDGIVENVPFKLGHIEKRIGAQLGSYSSNFIRVGRSHVFNVEYICNINITQRRVVLRSPSKNKKVKVDNIVVEGLKALKQYLERNLDNDKEDNDDVEER